MRPPGATEVFARGHDAAVCACLANLLSQDSLPTQALPQPTQRLVHLPLRFGGLGARSAVDAAPAACGPLAADRLVRALQSSTETVLPLTAARHAAACLREQGYDAPASNALLQARPGQEELHAWRHSASSRALCSASVRSGADTTYLSQNAKMASPSCSPAAQSGVLRQGKKRRQ